jgi:hypothetical protein
MNRKFILEFIVGISLLVSVIIFGQKGMVTLVLLVIIPFIREKRDPDERELQLLNNIGNITAGVTLAASVVIYYFSYLVINGQNIGEYWLFYVVSVFLISHGISGLWVFNRK